MSGDEVSVEELELLAKGDPAGDWDKTAHMFLARHALSLRTQLAEAQEMLEDEKRMRSRACVAVSLAQERWADLEKRLEQAQEKTAEAQALNERLRVALREDRWARCTGIIGEFSQMSCHLCREIFDGEDGQINHKKDCPVGIALSLPSGSSALLEAQEKAWEKGESAGRANEESLHSVFPDLSKNPYRKGGKDGG